MRVLGVNQPQQLQIQLVEDFLIARRVHPGARHPRQLTLPAHRQAPSSFSYCPLDPLPPHAHRLSRMLGQSGLAVAVAQGDAITQRVAQ